MGRGGNYSYLAGIRRCCFCCFVFVWVPFAKRWKICRCKNEKQPLARKFNPHMTPIHSGSQAGAIFSVQAYALTTSTFPLPHCIKRKYLAIGSLKL